MLPSASRNPAPRGDPLGDPRANRRTAPLWALLLLACGVRCIDLDRRPLHHDEAVNAWLTAELLRTGTYAYDPANYHGPTLFYLHAPVAWLGERLGPRDPVPVEPPRGELWVRSSAVAWGCLLLLAIGVAPGIGLAERCFGVLLAGSSCTLLYYQRYLIHEPLLLLLTFAMLLALERAQRDGWVVPAIICGLAAATKETFGLSLVTMLAAWGLAGALGRRVGSGAAAASAAAALPWTRRRGAALLAAPLTWALAISSCGTHPTGVVDGVRALSPWLSQAVETAHGKPFSYYLVDLLAPYDTAVLAAWTAALVLAAWRRHRRGLFFALWGLLLLAAYSAIPYKTPWLVLQPMLPMILAGAWAVAELHRVARERLGDGGRMAAVTLALGGAVLLLSQPLQTARVIDREADLERHPQAYVHTDRQIFDLLAAVRELSTAAAPEGLLEVVSPDYWPLPWYLRHFPATRFWGHLREIDAARTIGVLAAPAQRDDLRDPLVGWRRRTFRLRPGADLDLYTPPVRSVADTPGAGR